MIKKELLRATDVGSAEDSIEQRRGTSFSDSPAIEFPRTEIPHVSSSRVSQSASTPSAQNPKLGRGGLKLATASRKLDDSVKQDVGKREASESIGNSGVGTSASQSSFPDNFNRFIQHPQQTQQCNGNFIVLFIFCKYYYYFQCGSNLF